MAFSVRHQVYSLPPGVVVGDDAGVHAGGVHHVAEVVLERAVARAVRRYFGVPVEVAAQNAQLASPFCMR